VIDVECEADFLLRPFDKLVGARALLEHHLGPGCITVVPMKRHGNAELVELHGRPHVCLRTKLSKTETRWALCHELAEWRLDQLDYREEDREAIAEALAAALVTPRPALIRAVQRKGRDLPALAEAFVATQTSVALRLAETRCVEAAAVVRPGLVHVRAPDGFCLPPEAELKRAAAGEPSPLERHVLTDARRRVALIAA
jgi:hypothetical protein